MVRGALWLRESHVCWQRCACADPARASITTTSMLSKPKFSALQEIRKWSFDDVLNVLSKNGLKECCESLKKREIDGDTLLTLTEGKLALWKRDLTLTNIRKLTAFVQELNANPDKYIDKEKSDSKLNSLKVVTHLRSPPSSSHSDTISWNTDLEDEEEEENEGKKTQNAVDSARQQIIKSLEMIHNQQKKSRVKPPLPLRPLVNPPRLQENTNEKPLVPIPPVNIEDVTNIISDLDIPVIEERTCSEQFYDEFYESFDGENVADLQRLKDSLMNRMPTESTAERNMEINPQIQPPEKESIPPPLPSRSRSSSPRLANESFKEYTDQNSPPTPPPRNPPVNMIPDVKSFLHSSATSLNSSGLISNSPVTTPRMSLAFSEPEEEYEIVNENTDHNSSNVDGYISEEYESIQEHNILPPNNSNSLQNEDISEEYESINEHSNLSINSGDEYYLQPDPRQPLIVQKKMDQGPLNSTPPLPAKPKAEVCVPSGPPPSPPRRRSEDSSSSTTSGSGDSVSGRIGGLLRKVINRPAAPVPLEVKAMSVTEKCPQLVCDGFFTETVSSPVRRAASLNVSSRKDRSLSAATISYSPSAPTQCSRVFLKKQSEAKKTVSSPAPAKPPVERPLTFQRPLPPTPESKQVNADKIPSTNLTKPSKTPFSQLSYYHNVDRPKAEEMLKNTQDGSFIVRPSTKTQNPLTLTLWFRSRLYNINIRHRSDGKYALGTEKANEQSFNSVEELISNYQMEKLVLYSGGERTGKTLLTDSPRKDSSQ